MAGSMQTSGMEELSKMLAELGDKAEEVAAGSLYEGAKVMKNAMNAAIDNIRTEKFHYAMLDGTKRLPSPEEVAAIRNKVGVAKFNKNGSEIDTVVGLKGAGYAEIGGSRRPVIQVARSINSGTSFMNKQPFARQAINATKGSAQAAILAEAERRINEIQQQ